MPKGLSLFKIAVAVTILLVIIIPPRARAETDNRVFKYKKFSNGSETYVLRDKNNEFKYCSVYIPPTQDAIRIFALDSSDSTGITQQAVDISKDQTGKKIKKEQRYKIEGGIYIKIAGSDIFSTKYRNEFVERLPARVKKLFLGFYGIE